MLTFADYLSEADYSRLAYLKQSEPVIRTEHGDWSSKAVELLHGIMVPALLQWLEARREAFELEPLAVAGYDLLKVSAWNKFVRNASLSVMEMAELMQLLNPFIYMAMPGRYTGVQTYKELISAIDTGCCEFTAVGAVIEICQRSKTPIYYEWHSGNPRYGVLNRDKTKLVDAPILPDIAPGHATVNFPTGELIVTDWVRLNAFTETVNWRLPNKSLASEQLRDQRVAYYAKEHNFISISGPQLRAITVAQSNEILVAGTPTSLGVLPPEYAKEYVLADNPWALTLIDKADLLRILQAALGDEAQDVLAEYLVAEPVGLITVDPGTYHFYYSCRDSNSAPTLKAEYACLDSVTQSLTPYFFMRAVAVEPKLELPVEMTFD